MKPTNDVLPQVVITPEAAFAYSTFAASMARHLRGKATGPIPDERGYVDASDGSLVIYVDPPGLERIEYRIPAGQWASLHAHRNEQN